MPIVCRSGFALKNKKRNHNNNHRDVARCFALCSHSYSTETNFRHHRTIDQCSFHRLGTIVCYSSVIRHARMCDIVFGVVWCVCVRKYCQSWKKVFYCNFMSLIFSFLSFFLSSGLLFILPIHIQMNSHKFCRRPIIKRLMIFYCARLNHFESKFEGLCFFSKSTLCFFGCRLLSFSCASS